MFGIIDLCDFMYYGWFIFILFIKLEFDLA